jgi:hypothetical protein
MYNVIVLFLKCLDRGEHGCALDFQGIHDGLPLMEEERAAFGLKETLEDYVWGK